MMEAGLEHYPIFLGLKLDNRLNQPDGKIQKGRWVNLNSEDYDEESKWVKVPAVGAIVDRSLGGRKHAILKDELAIFSYYPHPKLEMMCFDLLPVRSPIFDMYESPSKDEDPAEELQLTPIKPKSRRLVSRPTLLPSSHNYPFLPWLSYLQIA